MKLSLLIEILNNIKREHSDELVVYVKNGHNIFTPLNACNVIIEYEKIGGKAKSNNSHITLIPS